MFLVLPLCLADIMNQKARLAWELYVKMGTSSDSFSLLQVIANDCYKVLLRPAAFASGTNRNGPSDSRLRSETFTHSDPIWILFVSGLEPVQKSLGILGVGAVSYAASLNNIENKCTRTAGCQSSV